jgi:hypothetical protein
LEGDDPGVFGGEIGEIHLFDREHPGVPVAEDGHAEFSAIDEFLNQDGLLVIGQDEVDSAFQLNPVLDDGALGYARARILPSWLDDERIAEPRQLRNGFMSDQLVSRGWDTESLENLLGQPFALANGQSHRRRSRIRDLEKVIKGSHAVFLEGVIIEELDQVEDDIGARRRQAFKKAIKIVLDVDGPGIGSLLLESPDKGIDLLLDRGDSFEILDVSSRGDNFPGLYFLPQDFVLVLAWKIVNYGNRCPFRSFHEYAPLKIKEKNILCQKTGSPRKNRKYSGGVDKTVRRA